MPARRLLWTLPALLVTSGAAADGLIEDSHLSLLNRNYFYYHDHHDGGLDGREWGHGLLWTFTSGFTQGPVGVGVDAHMYNIFKLDTGRGRNRTDLLVPRGDGTMEDTSSVVGGSIKLRWSRTLLQYGHLRPYNPVFALQDQRLLPATATGFMLTSQELERLSLDLGYFTSGKDYNRTHSDGGFYAAYAGVEGGDVYYAGGTWTLSDALSATLYGSQYTELWRQYYLNLNQVWSLADERALSLDLNYYRSEDQGEARLGELDIHAWSAAVGYTFGAHTLTLGYQKNQGDEPLDYLGMSGGGYQDSIYLGNSSQYADFNGPNEQSWRIQYNLDMASLGVPGLTFSIRHVRGSGIDGTDTALDSVYYGWYGKDEKHHTTDLDLRYVVQGGPAKDLMIRVRHAHHEMLKGRSDGDIDRFRVVIEYPWDFF